MVRIPGKTTYGDVYRHILRCFSASINVTSAEGLGLIEVPNAEELLVFDSSSFVHLRTEGEREALVPGYAYLYLVSRTFSSSKVPSRRNS